MKKIYVVLLIGALAAAAACKKSEPPAGVRAEKAVQLPMPSSRPAEAPTAPVPAGRAADMDRALEKRYPGNPAMQETLREGMAKLDAQLAAEQRLAEINRRTMVTPAPADFKPEPFARKVRLKLILEKQKIRVGEYPRFRLEMTNVGREAIEYQEFERSIFARGAGMRDSLRTMTFYLTDSKKKKKELMPLVFGTPSSGAPSSPRPTPFPSGMTEEEKEKLFQEISGMAAGSGNFRVKMLPGETLHSLGDDDSPVENFKPLFAKGFKYGEPGIYRLHVELDDRPEPVTEQHIKHAQSYATPETLREWHEEAVRNALGPVSSNSATFEVTR